MKNNVAAVLLAAGKGTRIGAEKQFLLIKGKPVFLYSLEKFVTHPKVKKVIVVVPSKKISYVEHIVSKKIKRGLKKIKIIKGGQTRQSSTFEALKFLERGGHISGNVVIHDAARPLITSSMITSVVATAQKFDGAVLGGKAPDLTLRVRGGIIQNAHPKEETYSGYTPQCFRFLPLWTAHLSDQRRKTKHPLDNIELLKKYFPKFKIKIVKVATPIYKITHRPDLKIIKALL